MGFKERLGRQTRILIIQIQIPCSGELHKLMILPLEYRTEDPAAGHELLNHGGQTILG
jgi:hypothetical protein